MGVKSLLADLSTFIVWAVKSSFAKKFSRSVPDIDSQIYGKCHSPGGSNSIVGQYKGAERGKVPCKWVDPEEDSLMVTDSIHSGHTPFRDLIITLKSKDIYGLVCPIRVKERYDTLSS